MNTFIFSGSYEDVDGNNKKLYLLTQKNPVIFHRLNFIK